VFDALSNMPGHGYLKEYDRDALLAAIQSRLNGGGNEEEPHQPAPDLLGPEWDVLAGSRLPTPSDDFALEEVDVEGPT
ncbi:UNVERIFIED_CONTAM: hypothetical protein ODW78_21565, partial [Salmonella enterica subsp. enterica serovar Enteritidis]